MFWHSDRLRRFGNSLLLSLAISLVLVAVSDRKQSSLLYRGDFPAFYATAVLASEGKYNEVYDGEVQHSYQRTFWPSMEDRYYGFSYPPYVIPLLTPLAHLTPHQAKLFVTAAMLCALALSYFLLRSICPPLWSIPQMALSASLTFAPLFFGLLGGQNVGLSLFCIAVAARGLRRGGRAGELLAGIALGFWLFKPNLALPMLAAGGLLCGRWYLVGAGTVAACYGALGLLVMGSEWLTVFQDAAKSFLAQENAVNRFQMIDIWSAYGALAPTNAAGRVVLAVVLTSAGMAAAYITFIALRRSRRREPKDRLPAFFLAAALTAIISPHVLFYELGWLIPATVFFFPPTSDRRIWTYMLVDAAAAGAVMIREHFILQPLGLLPVLIFLFAFRRVGEPDRTPV